MPKYSQRLMLPSGREAPYVNSILEADQHDLASKHGLKKQSLIADPFPPLFHASSFHRNSTGQDSMKFHTVSTAQGAEKMADELGASWLESGLDVES